MRAEAFGFHAWAAFSLPRTCCVAAKANVDVPKKLVNDFVFLNQTFFVRISARRPAECLEHDKELAKVTQFTE